MSAEEAQRATEETAELLRSSFLEESEHIRRAPTESSSADGVDTAPTPSNDSTTRKKRSRTETQLPSDEPEAAREQPDDPNGHRARS